MHWVDLHEKHNFGDKLDLQPKNVSVGGYVSLT